MQITEIIKKLKKYHKGEWNGVPISPKTTRDKILYGNPEVACTGIITTCWASIEVIQKAIDLNANLIIVHEALFYNRGDHVQWLEESKNQTYLEKKRLLSENGIVVFRNHDYIHSGIPMGDGYVDGIFYGVMNELGWNDYVIGDKANPMMFELPTTTAKEVAQHMMTTFNLKGAKLIGDKETPVSKVWIAPHIMGANNDEIMKIEEEEIDLVIAMELIDYTLSEYIRDSNQLKRNKVIVTLGHFNTEEPGMKYMIEYLPDIVGDIPCTFVASGDMYNYVIH